MSLKSSGRFELQKNLFESRQIHGPKKTHNLQSTWKDKKNQSCQQMFG
jgi:hypothetical protein